MKLCINCGYFLNCKEAEGNKTECNKFIKRKLDEENEKENVTRT